MKAIIIHNGVEIAELTNLKTPRYAAYHDILEECYIISNHMCADWTEDDRVTLLKPGLHRSTSVGDRIKLEFDDDPLSYIWKVAVVGYDRAGVAVKRESK